MRDVSPIIEADILAPVSTRWCYTRIFQPSET